MFLTFNLEPKKLFVRSQFKRKVLQKKKKFCSLNIFAALNR